MLGAEPVLNVFEDYSPGIHTGMFMLELGVGVGVGIITPMQFWDVITHPYPNFHGRWAMEG